MDQNSGRASLYAEWLNDQTVVTHQYSQAPLQWLGPVDPTHSYPVFYLRNPNGGLLAGDNHAIEIELADHAQLEIRTQSSTRLHPGEIQQQIQIKLHDHSTLIWIGHPLIPGKGTILSQKTHIQIAPTARLAYAEIWTAGRIGMGERWQFQQLTSEFQVLDLVQDSNTKTSPKLLLRERINLQFPHTYVSSTGILGDYSCWGSLYLLGDWGEISWPLSTTQWSVSAPDRKVGQILRQVGDQAETIWQNFVAVIRQ